jgi:hypothetical protein
MEFVRLEQHLLLELKQQQQELVKLLLVEEQGLK